MFSLILAGKLGVGMTFRKGNQALFGTALPPARNTFTIGTWKESSKFSCGYRCFGNEACSYFIYSSDTEDCIMKKLA